MISILFVFALVFLVSSCVPNGGNKELILGTAGAFRPFTYLGGENGDEPLGFDIELAKIIAKDQGKELKVKIIPFQELMTALDNEEIDMAVSFIAITEERKMIVDFSDPYFYDPTVPLIKKSDVARFKDINSKESLGENVKMAVMSKTLQEGYALAMARDNEVLIADTFDGALEKLINGEADAVILPTLLAREYMERHSELTILQSVNIATTRGGIAVKKGRRVLLDNINRTLKRLLDSGQYNNMIEQHVY